MENLKKKDSKIIFLVLFVYLFFTNVANYTIYSDIALFLLILVSFIYILKNKKIYLNVYFLLYVIFIIYQVFLIFTKTVMNETVTVNTLQTMLINLIFLICLYNLLIDMNDMNGFMKTYVLASIFSLAVIMLISRDNLFSGRLAHAWGEDSVSYYFLGRAVSMSSNLVATFCAISTLFSIYLYSKSKNSKYILFSLFLIFGVILTGSRKRILILLLYIVFIFNMIYKRKIALKIILIIIGIGGIGIAITKIPVLYDIIGERLIELLQHFFGNDTAEGSIMARERFTNYAIDWIKEKPLLGYGVGAFKYVYDNVTESNYLEMLVSGGVFGLIIYYLYSIPVIKRFLVIKEKDDVVKILFFIILSIWIIEYGSVTFLSRAYLMFIPVYFAYIKILKNEKKESERYERSN